jgi:hypothetical protein
MKSAVYLRRRYAGLTRKVHQLINDRFTGFLAYGKRFRKISKDEIST